MHFARVPEDAKESIVDQIPEVLEATNYMTSNEPVVYNKNNFSARVIHTDNDFFSIFNINTLSGISEGIFNDPQNAVLTKSCAQKIFGNENPIGKIIKISHQKIFRFCRSCFIYEVRDE